MYLMGGSKIFFSRDKGADWYVTQWLPWAGGPAWERAKPIDPITGGLHNFYWPRLPESVRGCPVRRLDHVR